MVTPQPETWGRNDRCQPREEFHRLHQPVRLAASRILAKVRDDIDTGLKAFQDAAKALSDARTDESLAYTRLVTATEAWERQIEKTYGALVAEFGRAHANGFFPRVGGKEAGKKQDASGDVAGAPANA